MKPPWKYLTRLVSRRRPSEEDDKASAPDDAHNLVELELLPSPTILLSSPEASSRVEREDEGKPEESVAAPAAFDNETDHQTPDLPPDFNEAPKADLTLKQEQSNFDPPEPQPTGEAPVQLPKPRQARLKGAKKDRVGSPLEMHATILDLPVPATSSTAGPFFDNATSLDEDIKQLKDLLRQKLRTQNAQLKEMLKRFDRS